MWPSARIAGPARYRPKVDRVMRWQMIEGCKASVALQTRSPDERRDIRALPPPMMPASRDSPNKRPGMMSRDYASLIRASATALSRLPKRLVYLAPSICRRKAHVPQLDVVQCGEKCAFPPSRVPFGKQRCTSFQRRRRQRASAVHLCLHPSRGFRGATAGRFISMVGCRSCHVRGCHDSCSCALRIPILGSLDRTVPHHIRRDTPLIAVDFETLVAV